MCSELKDHTVRGATRLDGARGKKQVWRPHVRNWDLSEVNVLYWRKYLWHCWDLLAPPHSPVAMGAFGGLSPPNKAPIPPNWNMRHYESVEFLSIFALTSPPHKRKAPYWKVSGDGSAPTAIRRPRSYLAPQYWLGVRGIAPPLLPSLRPCTLFHRKWSNPYLFVTVSVKNNYSFYSATTWALLCRWNTVIALSRVSHIDKKPDVDTQLQTLVKSQWLNQTRSTKLPARFHV